MLLAGVYTSTELYMTTDNSPDFQDTFAFLDRRLEDVMMLGKTIGTVKSFAEFGVKTVAGFVNSVSLIFLLFE